MQTSCMSLAGERQPGTMLEAASREAGVEAQAIAGMQDRLRAALGGDTGAISATRILHLYLERIGVDYKAMPAYAAVLAGLQADVPLPARLQMRLAPAVPL